MRFDEVVAEFVDENLIPSVNRAARNHFTGMITHPRRDLEIIAQMIGRTVNPIECLVPAFDSRECEKEENLFLLNLQYFVLLLRDDVDIIAAAQNKFGDLSQNVRRLRGHRPPDNAVERRLHRTGRNFEWLQKI